MLPISFLKGNSTEARPFVKVAFHGISSRFLYDTGASCSVLSLDEFRRISIDQAPKKLAPTDTIILDANGKSLQIYGRYSLKVLVEGRNVEHPFFVCPLTAKGIIGIDFINAAGLSYCAKSKQVVLTSENIFDVASLVVCREVVLPPFSASRVRVKVELPERTPVEAKTEGISYVAMKEHPFLSCLPTLNEVDNFGRVDIHLQNCGAQEIRLSRSDIIGCFERTTPDMIHQCPSDSEVQNRIMSLNSKQSSRGSTSHLNDQILNDKLSHIPEIFKQQYRELLLSNADVFSKDEYDIGRTSAFQHKIHLRNNEPCFTKQFTLPDAYREGVDKHIREWLKLGVIVPAKSRWNSPLFVVAKKEPGKFRYVLDYRKLNAQSLPDCYTLREMDSCILDIGRNESDVFSSLDLTSGFYQMTLHPSSQPYTAFTIPGYGQFMWTTTPMGLRGAPASFQKCMDIMMAGLHFVITYLDDCLVHSKGHLSHLNHLEQTFRRLRQFGMKLNLKKCTFGSNEVSYLGYRLTSKGLMPDHDKLKAIRECVPPRTVSEVRSFVGFANFYRSLIPNFASLCGPLTALTRKDSQWSGREALPPSALKAFQTLQSKLGNAPVVAFPSPKLQYHLFVDASMGDAKVDGGLGAILTQKRVDGSFVTIACASRVLQGHEKNYSAFLLEMLAATWAVEHFGVYLKGRHFFLHSDHKPLEKLSSVHKKTLSRLDLLMNEYDFTICHIPGSIMPSDYLSRHAINAIDFLRTKSFLLSLEEAQQKDPFIASLVDFIKHGTVTGCKTKDAFLQRYSKQVCITDKILYKQVKDKIDGRVRVVFVAPRKMQQDVLRNAHSSLVAGHAGEQKTMYRLSLHWWWPDVETDVKEFVQTCSICQANKTGKMQPKVPLNPLPATQNFNERVHMDLFGPLLSDTANRLVLVITDAFSKYVELVAIPDKEATTVASAFLNRWILRFGVPLTLVTDGGTEFRNSFMKELVSLLNVCHKISSPYHPQTCGQVESFNKTMGQYLRCVEMENTRNWEPYLPALAFSYNTGLHTSTLLTPAYTLFGFEPNVPGLPPSPLYNSESPKVLLQRFHVAQKIVKENNDVRRHQYEKHYNKNNKVVAHSIVPGDQVLVKREAFPLRTNKKLCRRWLGPYLVLDVSGEDLVLQDPQKQKSSFVVHINRIKRFVPNTLQVGSESDETSESEDPNDPVAPTRSSSSSTSGRTTPDSEEPHLNAPDTPPNQPDPEQPPQPAPHIPTPLQQVARGIFDALSPRRTRSRGPAEDQPLPNRPAEYRPYPRRK